MFKQDNFERDNKDIFFLKMLCEYLFVL